MSFKKIITVGLAVVALTTVLAGPASANNSEPWHIDRQGTSLAQVYFIDGTGPAWPVSASTSKWNESTRVKSYYLRSGSSCPHYLCASVYEVNYDSGYIGYTTVNYNTTTGHLNWAYINLNNYYPVDAAAHRHTACQEEGHVLGLDHQYPAPGAPTTCMDDSRLDTQLPNNHDYYQLTLIYNH
jgi:hypothetical protein